MKQKLVNLLLFAISKLVTKEKLLEELVKKMFPGKIVMIFLFEDRKIAAAMLELKDQIESGELQLVDKDDPELTAETNSEPVPRKPILQ